MVAPPHITMSETKKEVKEVLRGILMAIILYFFIQISLTVATGVDNPISVVISGSMDHHGASLDEWWMEKGHEYAPYGVTKLEFSQFPYANGFERGDILLIKGVSATSISVGDVIVFTRDSDEIPVVHRVVEITMVGGVRYFLTKGDFNSVADNYHDGETIGVHESRIIGRVGGIIPSVGNITLWFRGIVGTDA